MWVVTEHEGCIGQWATTEHGDVGVLGACKDTPPQAMLLPDIPEAALILHVAYYASERYPQMLGRAAGSREPMMQSTSVLGTLPIPERQTLFQ